MKTKTRRTLRADFNYITLILFIALIGGGWWLYAFIPGYYSSAQVSGILGDAIIRHHKNGDEAIKERVLTLLSKSPQYELTAADIVLVRDENSPVINGTINYIYVIKIPFTERRIDLKLKAEAYKDFTLSNSLN
ncbi:MAG: hypothetical protein COV44_01735 [Deltaproteobacteria bacterium CG11_big_fil_rev_8_21_14_0_20_45_16]|nr:MAG: hypothetical protein COV44_01735 [Deltaproteobacteria bacterium CG11_big_fil_rev_8_21_14_0_20_45_16]